MELTQAQREVLEAPLEAKTFLSGPAGCGKTTVGLERLRALLTSGLPSGDDVPADSILILTPQRTLQAPYEVALRDPEIGAGGVTTLATVSSLARRMVELFWPLAAESAGFAHPDQPPIFLTLETAQYYMAQLVRPLLDEGFFASVTIDRNRLYSQIIDNLNKSASVGFSHTEIADRLSAAWVGDPGQRRVYADAQECAIRFRRFCLEHNLLDFSLQLDIFWNILWRAPECRAYLTRQYRHLIYDNSEEDVPVAHDLFCEWLPDFDSALVIYDADGGYRRFLGADPESALRVGELCPRHVELSESFVMSGEIARLAETLVNRISPASSSPFLPEASREEEGNALAALTLPPPEIPTRFYPQMLDWVANEIHQLLDPQDIQHSSFSIHPSDIVILAPYLSDALRFSISSRLDAAGIPWRSHRPSRSLRDEPASHCLMTLAELAHPGWEAHPTKFDVAYALLYAIEGMDLVRAQLLAEIVYRAKDITLSTFEQIRPEVQERITFLLGSRYSMLRGWLLAYREESSQPLDHFLRQLFGEVLSQRGFGFHRNFDGARTASSLIDSVRDFRQVLEAGRAELGNLEVGKEYFRMLQEGLISAQYLEAWQMEEKDAILLAPAYTFLMMNRPVAIQFWLDAGSGGWWERLFQPLTQPHVLSRSWERGRLWTDADELAVNQRTLVRLVAGLLRRCKSRVYLGLSDLGESGFEQRGPLLKAIWRLQLERQAQIEE